MAEPVTLAEAKLQCHMEDDDSRDTVLTGLITRATAFVSKNSGLIFTAGTKTERFFRWGDYLEIWRYPVTAISTITYGADGTGTSYTGWQANLGSFPLRISPGSNGFPELADGESVVVTYTAGELDEDSNEYQIAKQAVLFLIGYWFNNDGEIPLDKDTKFAFDELLRELRPLSVY